IVNHLARRGRLQPRSELYGKAFESWVFHELVAHIAYRETGTRLTFWRLASGIEVDFVIDDFRVPIEPNATANVTSDHLKGLRHMIHDHADVVRRIVVCLEPKRRRTEDGISILPVKAFVEDLERGRIL